MTTRTTMTTMTTMTTQTPRPSRRRPVPVTIVVAGLALALVGSLTACGDDPARSKPAGGSGASTASGAITGGITVFAAASLTESFTALGTQFEQAHPGTTVTFSFGPSSGLAEQIDQGAPADVFASASTTTMAQVVKAGNASGPADFAANVLEIAVPADNPGEINRLSDLTRPGVKVALCQASVPCGVVAAKVFANAGLAVRPVSEEVDVKSVLSKVTLGEVDAGLVYVTDVRAAGDKITGVEIPADVNASTTYPIARLTASKNTATAAAFVAYVLSDAGGAALTAAGFAKP